MVFLLFIAEVNCIAQTEIDTNRCRIVFENPLTYTNFPFEPLDSIIVQGYDYDSNYVYGAIQCDSDSNLVIYLLGDTLANLLNFNLEFQFVDDSRFCTSKITDISYSPESDSTGLYINNCSLADYYAYYQNTFFCTNSAPEPIISDIPSEYIWITNSTDLYIDNQGTIYPELSVDGTYQILVSSKFCFPNSEDSIEISVGTATSVDLPDSLTVCMSGYGQSTDISSYFLVNPEEPINQDNFEILQSGYFLLSTEFLNECGNYDSVYINLVQPVESDFAIAENCENVTLGLNIHNEEQVSINWSTGSSAETIEVNNNDIIFVNLTDSYGCITFDSVFIDFKPMEIASVTYEKEPADCWKDGSITLSDINVNYNIGTYTTEVYNTLNGTLLENTNEVPDGIYKIRVTDERNCTKEYAEEIVVLQKCLEDYPVFSPNNDGIEDDYFIPHHGSVKIFDRNGLIIKELTTPAYWDGTDINGNLVSMGNYVIVTNNEKVVNITIVR